MNVFDLLKRHESCRLTPYRDSVGVWTVGWGHNCETTPISQAVADMMLKDDAVGVMRQVEARFAALSFWPALSDVRQAVCFDVAYNVGVAGFLKFHLMLDALERGDYGRAADELLNSAAAAIDTDRYAELAEMMRRDTWPSA